MRLTSHIQIRRLHGTWLRIVRAYNWDAALPIGLTGAPHDNGPCLIESSRPTKSPVISIFTALRKRLLYSGLWPCQCTLNNVIRGLQSRHSALADNGGGGNAWQMSVHDCAFQGGNMSQGMVHNNENQETGKEVLWRAVITSTVQEWMY